LMPKAMRRVPLAIGVFSLPVLHALLSKRSSAPLDLTTAGVVINRTIPPAVVWCIRLNGGAAVGNVSIHLELPFILLTVDFEAVATLREQRRHRDRYSAASRMTGVSVRRT
jgi:hypothetical protein